MLNSIKANKLMALRALIADVTWLHIEVLSSFPMVPSEDTVWHNNEKGKKVVSLVQYN